MAYTFGFRVPSELLGQWGRGSNPAKFELVSSECREVRYGPYRRKAQLYAGFTLRGCLCDKAAVLCPHLWIAAFAEQGISSAEGMTLREFTGKLQTCVRNSLPRSQHEPVTAWTSHVFRRGSATDILKSQGIKAMLKHGEWQSEASASAYASADEITTSKLREACAAMVDLSDEDN